MARRARSLGTLTWGDLNSWAAPYRVRCAFGVFSVHPRVDEHGIYWYAYKRAGGVLYKVYVGRQGHVNTSLLSRRLRALARKAGIFC